MLPGFRYDKTEMDTNVYKYTNTDINYWKRLLHSCQSTWDKNCVFKLAFLGFQLINLTNAKGKSYLMKSFSHLRGENKFVLEII